MKEENFNIQTKLDQIDFDQLIKHPNILIAANFWEKERFEAAMVCYKFMRRIDDLIDDHKAENKTFSTCEKVVFTEHVNDWIDCLCRKSSSDPFLQEVIETINKFHIPLHLFHSFAKSMIYDIKNSGFSSFNAFLNYSEGASVAPAAVFVHLACLKDDHSGYLIPEMDLLSIARPCALFSYIVHIIRDFQKDINDNLNYFAVDMLTKNKLNVEDLRLIANGSQVPESFRNLMEEYYNHASVYREKTENIIESLVAYLPERYMVSFEIIFHLYLDVYKRININNGTFLSDELNPTQSEIKNLVVNLLSKHEMITPSFPSL